MNSKNIIVLLLISVLCFHSVVDAFNVGRGVYQNRLSLGDTIQGSGRSDYDVSRELNGHQSNTYYDQLARMKPPSYLREDQKAEFYRRMQNILEKLDALFLIKKMCLEQPEDCQLEQRLRDKFQ